MEKLQEQLEKVESALEELRKLNSGEMRSRELSEAITCIETGSLWLIKISQQK